MEKRVITIFLPGGKLRLIIQGMDVPTLTDPDTMKQRRILFVNYFTRHFGTHNFYAWKFFFCEVLNLINILSQVRPCLTTSTLAWCIHNVANQAVIQGLSYIVDQIK